MCQITHPPKPAPITSYLKKTICQDMEDKWPGPRDVVMLFVPVTTMNWALQSERESQQKVDKEPKNDFPGVGM